MLGRDIAYLCTKFDHSSFSCSRDLIGAHQNLNGSRDLTMPLSGTICHLRNQPAYQKIEVSISAHYKYMKMDTTCGKWGGFWGSQRSSKVTGNNAIQ